MNTDNNLLNEAIAEARTLQELTLSQAKHSLKKFLFEEKLPLDDFDNAELDLDDFVDLIIKRSKEREEGEYGYDRRGLPYKDSRYNIYRANSDDDIDERARLGMRRSIKDDDEFDYSGDVDNDNDDDDDEKLSDELKSENIRRWNLKANSLTSPSIISVPKISEAERKLLLKHSGLLKNRKYKTKISENKQAKDFLIERAGINKSGIAKNVIADLETKRQLL